MGALRAFRRAGDVDADPCGPPEQANPVVLRPARAREVRRRTGQDARVTQAAAVVTGAGGGLGASIARRLGHEGWSVVVNDVDADAAQSVADAISDDGGRAIAVVADATDAHAVVEMVAAAREAFGPVLATVANASGPQGDGRVDELSWDYVLGHLEFCVKSPLALLQAPLPAMRAAGRGRVIHVASDLLDRGARG